MKQWNEDEVDECGCCEMWHPRDFYGDCRDDRYRLDYVEGTWPARYQSVTVS